MLIGSRARDVERPRLLVGKTRVNSTDSCTDYCVSVTFHDYGEQLLRCRLHQLRWKEAWTKLLSVSTLGQGKVR